MIMVEKGVSSVRRWICGALLVLAVTALGFYVLKTPEETPAADSSAALAWFARLNYAGVDPRLIVRRIIAHASEDVGLANPIAMLQAAKELNAWRLSDCTVYVTHEPCIMCAGLMHQARIRRCVYGAHDPKAGALGTLYQINADERLNHNFEVTPGVLQSECAQILKDFFARRRKEKGMSGRKV